MDNAMKMEEDPPTDITSDEIIMSGYKRLLIDGLFSDLEIIAGSPPNQEKFNVHRNIVCLHSDYFMAACQSCYQEGQEKRISLPDINPEIMRRVLEFLYSAEYRECDLATDALVFVSATYLQIPTLAKQAFYEISGELGVPDGADSDKRFPTILQKETLEALDLIYSQSTDSDRFSAGIQNICEALHVRGNQWDESAQETFDDLLLKHPSLGRDLWDQVRYNNKNDRLTHCGNCHLMSNNILKCVQCRKVPSDHKKDENMDKPCPLCGQLRGFMILCSYCRKKKSILAPV